MKSPLSVEIQNAGSSLDVSFIYGTDVFDRQTIAWMGRQYKTLLAAVVRDPESPIESLPLLADDERIDILKNWSSGGALE